MRTQHAVREDVQKIRTLSGLIVELGPDRWAYRDSLSTVNISFKLLAELMTAQMLSSYKEVLKWYVENVSPVYLSSVHAAFVKLVEFLRQPKRKLANISSVGVLNFGAACSKVELARLRPMILRWNAMGHPGVTEAAVILKKLRIGGGKKGASVLTMDPYIGPFTEVELGGIQTALDDAFVEGRVTEDVYLLTWLFIAFGARTVQYAGMKVCDVVRSYDVNGHVSYSVRIPRAKQLQPRPRTKFKVRPLVKEIGGPLFEYAQRVRKSFEDRLEDPEFAPLFPETVSQTQYADGFQFHRTASALTNMLTNGIRQVNVLSERTGKALNVSPLRFRRTLGTRAAQEGHSEYVIAELLDHSDTQNVQVYVACVPEIAERIDRAVAHQLAPLAKAFKGEVIRNETDAVRGNDESSRIIDLRIDRSGRPMGSCGQFDDCRFAAPIACYTCRSFQPWADGPHGAVLEYLLARRDRLFLEDKRIAVIHDRTILAVAEVVQRCNELNAEKSDECATAIRS